VYSGVKHCVDTIYHSRVVANWWRLCLSTVCYTAMFSNSASAQSMAQMKYANSGSAGGHLGSGMTGFASSFSATKQIEGA